MLRRLWCAITIRAYNEARAAAATSTAKIIDRKIVISACRECPHVGHKGAFAAVSYVPKCELEGKELPHSIGYSVGKVVVATLEETIPDWCPLEKNNE